jgi:transketolase C-terminal domain/subunit
MGNDDAMLLNEAAHIKIINVSCPQQLLGVMRWIMAGNRGIIYMRILRAPSHVIYEAGFVFEFGKSYTIKNSGKSDAFIVTSGRGVYEAIEATGILNLNGLSVDVVDMPSIDEKAIIELYRSGKPVFIIEQNNGYIWTNMRKILFANELNINTQQLIPINTTNNGELHYIHSGTYPELVAHYGLDSAHISETILKTIPVKKSKAKSI